MKRLKFIVILFLLPFLLLVSCKGKTTGNQFEEKAAHDFRLQKLDHQRFYLNEQKGKTVVLLFWATWCKICKGEMIFMNSLYDSLKTRDLIVATVCTDPENLDDVKEIINRLDISLPVLLDQNQEIANLYNVQEYPTTIVIDPEQNIKLIKIGYSPLIKEQLRNQVMELIFSGEREL